MHWMKAYDSVLDDSTSPFTKWFPGGEVNTCFQALDYHIESGRGDQAALIYDRLAISLRFTCLNSHRSPVTNTLKSMTYKELQDMVSAFAGSLSSLGVSKGDGLS